MRINPIDNNTRFKAAIVPTESLGEGFKLAERCARQGTMKDLNFTKSFLDSLSVIRDTNKIQKFKIEVDKRRPDYTYIKVNGRRISGGENCRQVNVNDDYLVVSRTIEYAKKFDKVQPTVLDGLKSEIEELEIRLNELKEQYSRRIMAEVEQAQKIIFDAK